MKRLREMSKKDLVRTGERSKRICSNIPEWQNLPSDLWGHIAGYFTDHQILKLLSLSKTSFFNNTLNTQFKESTFLRCIQYEIFDYFHKNELGNFIPLPMDRKGFFSLVNQFTAKRDAVLPQIKSLESQQERASRKTIYDFLELLNTACKEGNMLTFKEIIKSLPVLMKNFSNEVDENLMTPFACAAAHGREGICQALLLLNENQFDQEVEYDIGFGFTFAMSAIHIFALRSSYHFLGELFRCYPYALAPVFEENYTNALQDILNNDHESLRKKLETDKSLHTATDKFSWTLVQWASCFPHAKDCLELLLLIEANIQHDNSPAATYIAIATGNLFALELLVSKGEEVELFMNNSNGLHLCAYHGHYWLIDFLVNLCGINTINDMNHTPLSLARLNNHDETQLSPEKILAKITCVNILKAYGAKEDLSCDVLEEADNLLNYNYCS